MVVIRLKTEDRLCTQNYATTISVQTQFNSWRSEDLECFIFKFCTESTKIPDVTSYYINQTKVAMCLTLSCSQIGYSALSNSDLCRVCHCGLSSLFSLIPMIINNSLQICWFQIWGNVSRWWMHLELDPIYRIYFCKSSLLSVREMVNQNLTMDIFWFSKFFFPQDYCTNCEDRGMGRDRMAIMMIYQCEKTRNVA